MFWLKTCPRCKGDLYLDHDLNGRDAVCLQCGYRAYLDQQGSAQVVTRSARDLDQSLHNYLKVGSS